MLSTNSAVRSFVGVTVGVAVWAGCFCCGGGEYETFAAAVFVGAAVLVAVGAAVLVWVGAGLGVLVAVGCCCRDGLVAVAVGSGVLVWVAAGAVVLVAVGVGVGVSLGASDRPVTWKVWVAV